MPQMLIQNVTKCEILCVCVCVCVRVCVHGMPYALEINSNGRFK